MSVHAVLERAEQRRDTSVVVVVVAVGDARFTVNRYKQHGIRTTNFRHESWYDYRRNV